MSDSPAEQPQPSPTTAADPADPAEVEPAAAASAESALAAAAGVREQGATSADEAQAELSGWAWWQRQLLLAGVLVLVALVAFGLQQVYPSVAIWAWLIVIPIFGAGAWFMGGEFGQQVTLRGHVLHWVGVLVAIELALLLSDFGKIDRATSGRLAILLLALGTYTAGVHMRRGLILAALLLVLMDLGLILAADLWHVAALVLLPLMALMALAFRIYVNREAATGSGAEAPQA